MEPNLPVSRSILRDNIPLPPTPGIIFNYTLSIFMVISNLVQWSKSGKYGAKRTILETPELGAFIHL